MKKGYCTDTVAKLIGKNQVVYLTPGGKSAKMHDGYGIYLSAMATVSSGLLNYAVLTDLLTAAFIRLNKEKGALDLLSTDYIKCVVQIEHVNNNVLFKPIIHLPGQDSIEEAYDVVNELYTQVFMIRDYQTNDIHNPDEFLRDRDDVLGPDLNCPIREDMSDAEWHRKEIEREEMEDIYNDEIYNN